MSAVSTERLRALARGADHEFSNIADYFWKAPRLIQHETALELRKLDDYPNRALRWKLESRKLEHTFPYLISTGNVFTALSLFESYLLLLVGELQATAKMQLNQVRGNGLSRLFSFIRSAGIAPDELMLYEQIQAAVRVRNCLMHASGMLEWSRETSELRRIQATGRYLSREHREMRISKNGNFDELLIEPSKLGDRLSVSNEYSHVLCSYLRTYFLWLCERAEVVLETASNGHPGSQKPA